MLHNQGNEKGTIDFTPGQRPPPTVQGTILRIVFATVFVGVTFALYYAKFEPQSFKDYMIYFSLLFFYCFFGFFVRPKPGSYLGHYYYDYRNRPLIHGERDGSYYDDPFTNEDNINRTLENLQLLLFPGLLVSEALVDTFKLVFKKE